MGNELIAPVHAPWDFLHPHGGTSKPYLEMLHELLRVGLPVFLERMDFTPDPLEVAVHALLPLDRRNGPDPAGAKVLKRIGRVSPTSHARMRVRFLIGQCGNWMPGLLYLRDGVLRVHLDTEQREGAMPALR